ncbi:MAG: glutamine synthetase type III, partial [Cellulosilyticaceae bacterium]
RRGLLNLKTTPDALPYFVSEKNMHLFTSYGIFTEAELHSRYEILLENYTKTLSIEALTMLDMARKDILPAVCSYIDTITQVALHKKQLLPNLSCHLEETLVTNLSSLVDSLYDKVETLDNAFLSSKNITDSTDLSLYFKTAIIPAMQSLRIVVDELEMLVGRKYWPYPTYSELLFSV